MYRSIVAGAKQDFLNAVGMQFEHSVQDWTRTLAVHAERQSAVGHAHRSTTETVPSGTQMKQGMFR